MALFFDAAWFDEKLTERGLSRRVMAAAAGLSDADLALIFKDQKELTAQDVAVFADLLAATPAEIAQQAGISTPVPGRGLEERIAALEARVEALETEARAQRDTPSRLPPRSA